MNGAFCFNFSYLFLEKQEKFGKILCAVDSRSEKGNFSCSANEYKVRNKWILWSDGDLKGDDDSSLLPPAPTRKDRYIIPKTSERRRPRKGKIDMSECRRDFCFAQKAFPRDQRPRSWAELERCVCCQFACVARSSKNRRFTCHALSFINSSHRPLRIDNPRECDGETTANLHSESNQQLTACINDVTQCYLIRVCG